MPYFTDYNCSPETQNIRNQFNDSGDNNLIRLAITLTDKEILRLQEIVTATAKNE